jgi:hypothetical protein
MYLIIKFHFYRHFAELFFPFEAILTSFHLKNTKDSDILLRENIQCRIITGTLQYKLINVIESII